MTSPRKRPAPKKPPPRKRSTSLTIAEPMPDEKRGAGRPGFEPTDTERELVETLAGIGLPQDQIAHLVRDGIDPKTLRQHFRRELTVGTARANAKALTTLYSRAIAGDTACLIFWLKARCGLSERGPRPEEPGDTGEIDGEGRRIADPNVPTVRVIIDDEKLRVHSDDD